MANCIDRLYLYTMTYDSGFAPNPFHGICTLACCKPGIRRGVAEQAAEAILEKEAHKHKKTNGHWKNGGRAAFLKEHSISDFSLASLIKAKLYNTEFVQSLNIWVAGLAGAVYADAGGVVYLMQVTDIFTFKEYWEAAKFQCKQPNKAAYFSERGIDHGQANKDFANCGDNIYEISENGVSQLPSFHRTGGDISLNGLGHLAGDLSGGYVLASNNYVYYGENARPIAFQPDNSRGHSIINSGPALAEFNMIAKDAILSGVLLGKPHNSHKDFEIPD